MSQPIKQISNGDLVYISDRENYIHVVLLGTGLSNLHERTEEPCILVDYSNGVMKFPSAKSETRTRVLKDISDALKNKYGVYIDEFELDLKADIIGTFVTDKQYHHVCYVRLDTWSIQECMESNPSLKKIFFSNPILIGGMTYESPVIAEAMKSLIKEIKAETGYIGSIRDMEYASMEEIYKIPVKSFGK